MCRPFVKYGDYAAAMWSLPIYFGHLLFVLAEAHASAVVVQSERHNRVGEWNINSERHSRSGRRRAQESRQRRQPGSPYVRLGLYP